MPSSQAQKSINQAVFKATKLTGLGKLLDATRLIQRALFGAGPSPIPASTSTPAQAKPDANNPPAVIILPAADGYQPTPAAKPGRKASFSEHAFAFEGDNYPYRLYIPAATGDAVDELMPLVVLLHGCKQDALDFARHIN